MLDQIAVRLAKPGDLPFIRAMLFEAAYWRPGQARPSLDEGLARPDLAYLLAGWGRSGDTAVIATTSQGNPVGAAWYRFWREDKHSYGYVGPHIPEIGIAVHENMRAKGIGHRLLAALLAKAASQGIEAVSLSVEVDNPARLLYQAHGFEIVARLGNSWTMVAQLKPKAFSQP